MVASDLQMLLEMGFDQERATLAAEKTGSLQDAIDWLDKHADTPLDQLRGPAPESTAAQPGGSTDQDGDQAEIAGTAASLKCTDCGKLFSSQAKAQWHASRTEHQNFEESTEIIKPLTEEEKKAKLAELKEKLAAKRAAQAAADAEEHKKNEAIRRKTTQDTEKAKEELRRKEQLKEVEKRKQEKIDDAKAKARVLQKIKEQQEEKRRRAEKEKAQREGRSVVDAPAPSAPKREVNHAEARLQLRLPGGQPPLVKTFGAQQTLFEVALAVEEERNVPVLTFSMTFPRKVFARGTDFGMTLKEAGLVPSCALIVG